MFPNENTIGQKEGAESAEEGVAVEGAAALEVGRIGEDQVEGSGGRSLQVGGHFALEDFALEVAMGEVVADALGGFGVVLDEKGGGGAAAEGLNAEGAGAGVEVEDAGAGDALSEAGEDDLADAVLGGAEGVAFGGLEVEAAGGTGNDAQRHEKVCKKHGKSTCFYESGE